MKSTTVTINGIDLRYARKKCDGCGSVSAQVQVCHTPPHRIVLPPGGVACDYACLSIYMLPCIIDLAFLWHVSQYIG